MRTVCPGAPVMVLRRDATGVHDARDTVDVDSARYLGSIDDIPCHKREILMVGQERGRRRQVESNHMVAMGQEIDHNLSPESPPRRSNQNGRHAALSLARAQFDLSLRRRRRRSTPTTRCTRVLASDLPHLAAPHPAPLARSARQR